MTHHTDTERQAFEAVASDDGKWPQAIERDAKGNYLLLTTANGWMWWQAARRAPLVIDTRARYSGSIQELKQYASEDVDAMVHICNKHIGNVPKGFFLAMQECAALVGRAPSVPDQSIIEAVDGWFARNTGLGGCSDKDVAELAAIFAAAPQPPEAAPVQMSEPDAGWFKYDRVSRCWHPQYSEYAETHAKREGWQNLYTEQQVRQLLAAQARKG